MHENVDKRDNQSISEQNTNQICQKKKCFFSS